MHYEQLPCQHVDGRHQRHTQDDQTTQVGRQSPPGRQPPPAKSLLLNTPDSPPAETEDRTDQNSLILDDRYKVIRDFQWFDKDVYVAVWHDKVCNVNYGRRPDLELPLDILTAHTAKATEMIEWLHAHWVKTESDKPSIFALTEYT